MPVCELCGKTKASAEMRRRRGRPGEFVCRDGICANGPPGRITVNKRVAAVGFGTGTVMSIIKNVGGWPSYKLGPATIYVRLDSGETRGFSYPQLRKERA